MNILYAVCKRIIDILLSFIGLVVLCIPLLIISLVIRLNSKGPAIFVDKRVGKNNKNISVYKFRSMYIDAEKNIDKYLTPEQKEIWLKERKLNNDPRITSVGRFIRKTSIDELPQLLNIFVGSLSIVGPRPISRKELEENFTDDEKTKLLSVKPGLTGYWQVYGRNDIEFKDHKRQELELTYIDKKSFWMDIKIFFLTIPAVLSHKGVKQ